MAYQQPTDTRNARRQTGGPGANPYETPFPNQYGNYSFYDQQAPQLFEDTSTMSSNSYNNTSNDYYMPQASYSQTQPFPSGHFYPPPQFQPDNYINQQVLMSAGAQIIKDQVATAANFYSQDIVNKSKSWLGHNLRYYFAVDTSYVLKKLILIFFPFTHKNWVVKFSPNEPVAPRDDVNSPDLYIPLMAIVTYLLVAGYFLGFHNQFSPEQLGIHASSAIGWLLLEVVAVLMAFYLMSISSALGFFHLVSYCSYKFVCMIGLLLISLPFSHLGYFVLLGYSSLSLGYFLVRSLHATIETTSQPHNVGSRNALYIVIGICLFQPLLMYLLTKNFVNLTVSA